MTKFQLLYMGICNTNLLSLSLSLSLSLLSPQILISKFMATRRPYGSPDADAHCIGPGPTRNL